VVSFETNALFVIDLTTNSVVDTTPVPGPGASAEVVITPDSSTLYIEGQNGIVVMNALTLDIITSIPIGGNVQSIAITPDGSKVYTADSNFYYVIDTASNTIVDTVLVPGPFDVDTFTVSPDGQTAYLTNFSSLGPGGLIISTATNQITDTLPRPPDSNSPTELGFLPDGSKAYLTDFNEDFISQYDPVSNTFTGNFTVGDFPEFSGFTSDGNFAYITRLDAVTVFNTQSNTVVDNILPIAEGDEFFGVAVCRSGGGVAEVPTLSEWGLILVVSMLGIAGFTAIRRRKVAA
jgi:DNA-binding beta-propeller fold protein YncE